MSDLEDRLAIQDLMGRYIDAVNRSDGDAWINCWAEDNPCWNLMGQPVTGREQILGLWQGMMSGFEFALMMPSSNLCTIEGNTASGHWYLHEYLRDKEGVGQTVLSRYVDKYVKVDGQWYFQTRDYGFIYNGPADMSGTYTPLSD